MLVCGDTSEEIVGNVTLHLNNYFIYLLNSKKTLVRHMEKSKLGVPIFDSGRPG